MAGLYVASIVLALLSGKCGLASPLPGENLSKKSLRQVEADGVGKERATEYQLFILEFFLLAGALGQSHR